ncbi:uncharacterized protein LOC126662001 [Mercurialis annua]|uniref:uncharacterized protein LOC126662001 n=1 Tax=Mercurialis annua TaxID=3986 RepID=UPI00215EFDE3|nr:uncharacterized protein LOC126662001 [Mercurialis annua]
MVIYVDDHGEILERFLSVVHVTDTSSHTLKEAIDNFFAMYGLSISRLQGQAYDRASNMHGEFNGLKSLILNENLYARYVHCFAHQLQLAVVAVAKILLMENSFSYLSTIVNIIGTSYKRKYALIKSHHDLMVTRLEKGEFYSEKGLHQETSLARPRDIRWGSHYQTVIRILLMWPSVMEVLGNVHDDATSSKEKRSSSNHLGRMDGMIFFDETRKFFVENSIDVPNLEDSLPIREFYTKKNFTFDLMMLSDQLEIYIHDVRQSADFVELVRIGQLTKKLIETVKYIVYHLIYRLNEQALIFPVSTASVERTFSAMNIIKTDLRNKIEDEFLKDSLSCFIQKQIFVKINDELILQHFQVMQT